MTLLVIIFNAQLKSFHGIVLSRKQKQIASIYVFYFVYFTQ